MSLLLREHSAALLGPAAYLARVVSVKDPDSLNRVQIRIYNCDGNADEDAPVWARVAVPVAGANKGAFLFPDTGDEVLVVFLSGDTRFPVVVGSLWNGSDSAPEQFGGSGDRVDRWTFTGKNGTRVAIVEEQSGQETIKLSTPGGQVASLTDAGGGTIELTHAGGSSIRIDTQGITINSIGKVTVTAASQVEVTAAQVSVTAAMSTFTGIVKCDVLQATTVIATTYTPGAGNIW
ncbi:MAG: phage baseplate assembly protein V [Acidobacteriota bacterium]